MTTERKEYVEYAKLAMAAITRGVYSNPLTLVEFAKNAAENKRTINQEIAFRAFATAKAMQNQENIPIE